MVDRNLRELLSQIDYLVKTYGEGVLDYPVFVEQCSEDDKQYKRTEQKWEIHLSPEMMGDEKAWDNEYFEVLGGVGMSLKEKRVLISVNY